MSTPALAQTTLFSHTAIVEREALTIVAHRVETSHANVGQDAPRIWGAATNDPRLQRLMGAAMQDAVLPAAFVGVYTDYEDGHTGAYAMLVGVPSASTDIAEDDLVTQTLPAGRYREFVVEAPTPEKVVAVWNYIWNAMPDRHLRTYAADYEVHTQERATLYVGLQDD